MQVKVYKNLHANKFSIVADEGADKGKVIGHAADVFLMDVTFRVSEAGRQRVLREGVKNVHAYVCGSLLTTIGLDPYRGRTVPQGLVSYMPNLWNATRNLGAVFSYNPFKAGFFADAAGRKMISAQEVILSTRHAAVAVGGMRGSYGDAA